jgi:hypothetical protein
MSSPVPRTTKATKVTKKDTKARRAGVPAFTSFLVAPLVVLVALVVPPSAAEPSRQQILDAMKRATTFMTEKVSYKGGYVWSYLPDFSRTWGELEARRTMVWIQPPGTPTMGHLFLDAYHATGDDFYYKAAERVAEVLAAVQHPSGGWNYVADLAGEQSLREWYHTVGRNAWRLEEFQHYWPSATFDDAGTAEAATFFLRLYVEKRDGKFKPPLEKALEFLRRSQYPNGAWPQRFPLTTGTLRHGNADYTSYMTFNDDVAAQNLDFLVLCYSALRDKSLLDPIQRGMNAFVEMQHPKPQAGWALQYTTDGKPAGARTYEPNSLVTSTTAANIELLIKFYRMTGDPKFLARIPDALDWLEGLTLPAGVAPPGRTHPTFVELGTNKPLYVHREGSNVFNGRYYVDGNPARTIAHYSSFRRVDVAALRKAYAEAKAIGPFRAEKSSPLVVPAALPRFVAVVDGRGTAADAIARLDEQGRWIGPLGMNSYPFKGDGPSTPVFGDFSQTYVGDETDTSPYPDKTITGLSTEIYIRNMSVLIRALEQARPGSSGGTP